MLHLGVVAYLNMQPLVYGLAGLSGSEVKLHTGPPSALARWLAAGEIDAGMAPVASLFQHPEWRIMPAPPEASALASMIGANGPVRSVLVVGGGPKSSWRKVRLDSQSMTSNALAQILLRRALGLAVEFEVSSDVLEKSDIPSKPEPGVAQVLIGSRALEWLGRFGNESQNGWEWLDLGSIWKEWTGLPFVFALWAVCPGAELGDWPAKLEALKRTNLARISTIAAQWPRLGEEHLTPQSAADYLTHNIHYDFDDAAQQGLDRFYQLGIEEGLFPARWKFDYYFEKKLQN